MTDQPLEGRRVAILAEELYEDLELWYPFYRLKEAGADVSILGTGAESYRSKHGYPVRPDLPVEQTTIDEFDAVVVPGGYAPDRMRRSSAMVEMVRAADQQGKVVAAICHAPWLLISAGIVSGRRATCYFSIKDDLVNAGATYLDQEVVVDGNLITSRRPGDLPAFCRAIISALRIEQPASVGAVAS